MPGLCRSGDAWEEGSRHATAAEPKRKSNPAHRLDAVSLGSPIKDVSKRLVRGGLYLQRQAAGRQGEAAAEG